MMMITSSKRLLQLTCTCTIRSTYSTTKTKTTTTTSVNRLQHYHYSTSLPRYTTATSSTSNAVVDEESIRPSSSSSSNTRTELNPSSSSTPTTTRSIPSTHFESLTQQGIAKEECPSSTTGKTSDRIEERESSSISSRSDIEPLSTLPLILNSVTDSRLSRRTTTIDCIKDIGRLSSLNKRLKDDDDADMKERKAIGSKSGSSNELGANLERKNVQSELNRRIELTKNKIRKLELLDENARELDYAWNELPKGLLRHCIRNVKQTIQRILDGKDQDLAKEKCKGHINPARLNRIKKDVLVKKLGVTEMPKDDEDPIFERVHLARISQKSSDLLDLKIELEQLEREREGSITYSEDRMGNEVVEKIGERSGEMISAKTSRGGKSVEAREFVSESSERRNEFAEENGDFKADESQLSRSAAYKSLCSRIRFFNFDGTGIDEVDPREAARLLNEEIERTTLRLGKLDRSFEKIKLSRSEDPSPKLSETRRKNPRHLFKLKRGLKAHMNKLKEALVRVEETISEKKRSSAAGNLGTEATLSTVAPGSCDVSATQNADSENSSEKSETVSEETMETLTSRLLARRESARNASKAFEQAIPSDETGIRNELVILRKRLAGIEGAPPAIKLPWEDLTAEQITKYVLTYKESVSRVVHGKDVIDAPSSDAQFFLDRGNRNQFRQDTLVKKLNLTEIPEDDSPIYKELHEKDRKLWLDLKKYLKSRLDQLNEALDAFAPDPSKEVDSSQLSNFKKETMSSSNRDSSPNSKTRWSPEDRWDRMMANHIEPNRPSPPTLSSFSNQLDASRIPIKALPKTSVEIASLAHGLQKVLFNPGVHFLQDPRSRVWNFPRGLLDDVPPLDDFDQEKLPRYVTSSKDQILEEIAKEEGKKMRGSTSSTVALLCQIYFWMSKGKEVNLDMLSTVWQNQNKDFSMGQQLPASIVINYKDGHYSIDSDKSMDLTDGMNPLASYGHMMEKLLTTDEAQFRRFLKSSSDPAASEIDHPQAYHYMTTDQMVLRSQLDAYDSHLPNVTFDVKTRGTVAIRQDRLNYLEGSGYRIDQLKGLWDSFEREYYDLIRSAFLKYQFQARIGHMDGCFVAYHSTKQFYGFQYVPIEEMDIALFGSHETGKQVFPLALGILEKALAEATQCYPEQSVRVTFAANTKEDVLRVFVLPHNDSPAIRIEEEDVAGASMTLLELRGSNYLNGQPQKHVVIHSTRVPPVWQIGYDITKSSTADPDSSPVSPQEMWSLLKSVRSTQSMFSTLFLPSGVSSKDLDDAAKRIIKAEEEGEVPNEEDTKLVRMFPERNGVRYGSPSRNVRTLRSRARAGSQRTLEMKVGEDEDGEHFEMQSTLVVKNHEQEP